MSNWSFKTVYSVESEGLYVGYADSDRGNLHTVQTMLDRTGGVQFLTHGSVNVYTLDMTLLANYSVGERFGVGFSTEFSEGRLNMASLAPSRFYCIGSKGGDVEWDGSVVPLAAGETITLTEVLGKRLLVTQDGTIIDGTAYDKHQIIKFDIKDSVQITGGAEDSHLALFYKVV